MALKKGFVFKHQFNYLKDKNPGIIIKDEYIEYEVDKDTNCVKVIKKTKVSDRIKSVARPSFKESLTRLDDGTIVVNSNVVPGVYADVSNAPKSLAELKKYATNLTNRINELEKAKIEQEAVAKAAADTLSKAKAKVVKKDK